MESSKVGYWLQVGANLGLLAGLVLVGLQLAQNTDVLRLQMLHSESRRTTEIELAYVGERGAQAWENAIERPAELSFAEQRIVESLIWSTFEGWRHSYLLHTEGLLGEEWADRVGVEAPYYLDHIYGRAWWDNFKALAVEGEIPAPLLVVIDAQLTENSNFHREYHGEIMRRVRERVDAAANDSDRNGNAAR